MKSRNDNTNREGSARMRTFTEAQVTRIVGERLARERKNNEALGKVKDMLMNSVRAGVLKSENIADMAGELEELLAKLDKVEKDSGESKASASDNTDAKASMAVGKEQGAKDATDVKMQSISDASAMGEGMGVNGTESTDIAGGRSAKSKGDTVSKEDMVKVGTQGNPVDAERVRDTEVDTDAEVAEFISLFPDIDLEELLCDEDFLSFAESLSDDGKRRSVSMVYIAYLKDTAKKLKAQNARRKTDFTRGLASTGFSARSGGGRDYSDTLTPNQMRIARDAGMSYREYADYLSQIGYKS